MNLASLADGLFQSLGQFTERSGTSHTHAGSQILHARLWAHPNNIVHVHVVPVQTNVPGIHVHQPGKPGHVQTKEIKERTILTEFIRVRRIICRSFLITQYQYQAATHLVDKLLSSIYIHAFIKHIYYLFND